MNFGRPVMYAFLESEHFAPTRKLFDLFKGMTGRHYPVRTFVMDKLASQMRAARVLFRCDVMLCYFHIREAIRKHVCHLISMYWAVNAQSGMVHFVNVTNNRLENAEGRLKDRVHHADTLKHAIQKVSRQAEWLMRQFELHTSYHCDRREILEGDSYVLNVVCRKTTYACSLVLRHLGPRPPSLPYDSVGTNKRSIGSKLLELFFIDFFLACFPIHQRWLSEYNLPEKGAPVTLVPKPPLAALDALPKQPNRVADKLPGPEPRKATASFKQLIVHGQILLRQGSNSANDGLPSVVQDAEPQLRLRSRGTDLGFCVICNRPTATSDRWYLKNPDITNGNKENNATPIEQRARSAGQSFRWEIYGDASTFMNTPSHFNLFGTFCNFSDVFAAAGMRLGFKPTKSYERSTLQIAGAKRMPNREGQSIISVDIGHSGFRWKKLSPSPEISICTKALGLSLGSSLFHDGGILRVLVRIFDDLQDIQRSFGCIGKFGNSVPSTFYILPYFAHVLIPGAAFFYLCASYRANVLTGNDVTQECTVTNANVVTNIKVAGNGQIFPAFSANRLDIRSASIKRQTATQEETTRPTPVDDPVRVCDYYWVAARSYVGIPGGSIIVRVQNLVGGRIFPDDELLWAFCARIRFLQGKLLVAQ
ncbi:hypothetical protein CLF_109895, partial [Clonorchis sinensis]